MPYLRKQVDNEATEAARAAIALLDKDKRISPSPDPVCDWCTDGVPIWVYASRRMASGEYRECWRWMACLRCSRAVENGNWDVLHRRVAARFKKYFFAKHPGTSVSDALVDEAVAESLKQFELYAIRVETGL